VTLGALLTSAALVGCSADVGQSSDDITDVPHTAVERQSISNCWLYAEASWIESMHLAATGEAFDASQSYWSYWHWFNQIHEYMGDTPVTPGGSTAEANGVVLAYGLMPEAAFVPEDAAGEMSTRQSDALRKINEELSRGRLSDPAARGDATLVRQVLDDAWGLSPEVRGLLDRVFGADGYDSLLDEGVSTDGTPIISPRDFQVQYTERVSDPSTSAVKRTDLATAMSEWRSASYPRGGEADLQHQRRAFQIRVQRALHDAQPVVIVWDVDFNAMESGPGELQGSFNLTTLQAAGGPGSQGGHTTVLEDYQAITVDYGLLAAGETLDPNDPTDRDKLEALLEPSTEVVFFRIKNSWGALRDDRSSAPGFPGYHDLYLDYLDGPIPWCPKAASKSAETCTGTTVPLISVMLPPGY
jgi:hypothetical protein